MIRQEHRKQIARDAATKHPATIAREQRVSVVTVKQICREQGAGWIRCKPWQRQKEQD